MKNDWRPFKIAGISKYLRDVPKPTKLRYGAVYREQACLRLQSSPKKRPQCLQFSVSHTPARFAGIVICFSSCTEIKGWNNLLAEYRLEMAIVSGKDAWKVRPDHTNDQAKAIADGPDAR